MSLSPEEVRKVAVLARLSLSSEEETIYGQQLSAILQAISQLSALDTSGVEPTSHATLAGQIMREDVVAPSLPKEDAMANAPSKVGSSFSVPKILE